MDNILLHIGLAKTASTFLKTWFKAHPQLFYSEESLAGFRNVRAIIDFAVHRQETAPMYYVTSSEMFSHAYLTLRSTIGFSETDLRQHQANVCTILHELFPSARVLIVTRGFRKSLYSGFSEYVKKGGTLDYPAFLNTFRLQILQWLDLNSLVHLYTTRFGEEKILVLPYELLRDNPPRFFNFIEAWLGLDHYKFDLPPVNRSLTSQELYWYPRFSALIAACTGKLNGYGLRLYKRYVDKCLKNTRLHPLARLLGFFSDRQVTEADCPAEYLNAFRHKGTILKHNPVYADYLTEYFLDEQVAQVLGGILQK